MVQGTPVTPPAPGAGRENNRTQGRIVDNVAVLAPENAGPTLGEAFIQNNKNIAAETKSGVSIGLGTLAASVGALVGTPIGYGLLGIRTLLEKYARNVFGSFKSGMNWSYRAIDAGGAIIK